MPQSAGKPRRIDIDRALLACAGLIFVFALAFYFSAGGATPSLREALFARSALPQHNDDDLATGSVIFVPQTGNACRERLIDNATWTMRDAGTVPCDRVFSGAHRGSGLPGSARLDAIRDSFRK
jgi:hypothetical protein